MTCNDTLHGGIDTMLALVLLALLPFDRPAALLQDRPPRARDGAAAPASRPAPRTAAAPDRGLVLNSDAAFPGYTLFAPLNSKTTYLVDMQGKLVHFWKSRQVPGQSVRLLDDGTLLRSVRIPSQQHFGGGGIGGGVERLAPDGSVLWEFRYADEHHWQHHDFTTLPNGNVLLIAWEKKSRDQAVAAGRDPKKATNEEFWPDCVVEVKPGGAAGGTIVWEWHVWDHLVQDFDSKRPNFGVIAEHPELVNLNFGHDGPRESPEELRRLRGLGYIGGDNDDDAPPRPPGPRGPGGGPGRFGEADWCHTNAIAYNAKLDQIALSIHNFHEIWIIDHGTTTAEAAGHAGGKQGRGGDLLYRWGNPRTYAAGKERDQQLFGQHDVRWIPDGSPGAGNIMIFNNGMGRRSGRFSSVVEIAPPVDASGKYAIKRGEAFGPEKPAWEYTAKNKTEFFAGHISGAHRLPNGATLVCDGESGRIFEVSADGKTVWDYLNPYLENERDDGEGPPPFGPPGTNGRGPRGDRGGPIGRRGGPDMGGLFRATRLAADDPGIRRLLGSKSSP